MASLRDALLNARAVVDRELDSSSFESPLLRRALREELFLRVVVVASLVLEEEEEVEGRVAGIEPERGRLGPLLARPVHSSEEDVV